MRTSADAVAQGPAIFISFASRDGDAANRVVSALEKRHLRCWISSRDIPPGADYQARIVAAIEAAPIMLLLLSRNAVASKEMPKETSIASRLDRVIVPVLIDNAEVTGALSYQATSAQRLDLSKDFEAGVDKLAMGLSHTLDHAAETARHLRRLSLRRRIMAGLAWPLAIALILLGAAAVWRFQEQVRDLRDSFAAGSPPGPQGTPAQASRTYALPTPAVAAEDTAEARTRAFVQRYYLVLSGPGNQVSGYLEGVLQDPVQYYGRPEPRRVLVAEETAYTQRWPDRRFVIRPDTLVVTCRPNQICSASGVIDYLVQSSSRHLASSGAESFDMRIVASPPAHLASLTTAPVERQQTQQP